MVWHDAAGSLNNDNDPLLNTRQPIGVFDSGVGGLTVFTELQRVLPNESILYFGDTANLPYGTKTPSEILHFVRAILNWMVSRNAKMVIMACNTSSALALEQVQSEYTIPILGVILPAARAAVQNGERLGVIATPATVRSHAYRNAIQEIAPQAKVWEIACPEFVPLIERNRIHEPETRTIVSQYLRSLIQEKVDTLVYGCTHYPYLSSVICDLLPPTVRLINPAVHVIQAAKQELKLMGSQGKPSTTQKPIAHFFVSDRPHRFSQLATKLMGNTLVVQQQNVLSSTPLSEYRQF